MMPLSGLVPIAFMQMGEVVFGGIGSIRGAFYASLAVGLVDTMGRAYMPQILRGFLDRNVADAAGPALASMLIYLFMAWRYPVPKPR